MFASIMVAWHTVVKVFIFRGSSAGMIPIPASDSILFKMQELCQIPKSPYLTFLNSFSILPKVYETTFSSIFMH